MLVMFGCIMNVVIVDIFSRGKRMIIKTTKEIYKMYYDGFEELNNDFKTRIKVNGNKK